MLVLIALFFSIELIAVKIKKLYKQYSAFMESHRHFTSPIHVAKERVKVLDFNNDQLLVYFPDEMPKRIELISHGKLYSSLAVTHMIERNPSGNCIYVTREGASKLFAIDKYTLKKQRTCIPSLLYQAKPLNQSTVFVLDPRGVMRWNLTLGSKEMIYQKKKQSTYRLKQINILNDSMLLHYWDQDFTDQPTYGRQYSLFDLEYNAKIARIIPNQCFLLPDAIIFDENKFAIGSGTQDQNITKLELYDKRTYNHAVSVLEHQNKHEFANIGSARKLNQNSIVLLGRKNYEQQFIYQIDMRKGAILDGRQCTLSEIKDMTPLKNNQVAITSCSFNKQMTKQLFNIYIEQL